MNDERGRHEQSPSFVEIFFYLLARVAHLLQVQYLGPGQYQPAARASSLDLSTIDSCSCLGLPTLLPSQHSPGLGLGQDEKRSLDIRDFTNSICH